MKKHTIVIGIILTLALLLSACGGGATPTPTQAPTEVPPTDEPEAVETEVAVESEETEIPVVEETEAAEAMEETEAAELATQAAETAEEAETVAVADGTMVLISFQNATVRTGPGTGFEIVESLSIGTRLPVIARTEGSGAALWYLVALESGDPAWVWSRVVTLEPSDAEVAVAATVPAPPGS